MAVQHGQFLTGLKVPQLGQLIAAARCQRAAVRRKPAKKPTGKKPGGQPGHPPLMKTLVPPERVNHVVPYVPNRCAKCDQALPSKMGVKDPEPKRHQVAELPPVMVEITEHQAHGRTCPCCGEVTWATIPADVRAHSVGAKFTAFMGLLAGVHGVSKRGIEELMEQAFDVSIALGTVSNREQELSEALAPAHAEARQAIASADVKHADETGWKEAGKKRWLWVAAIPSVVYFVIHPCRNLSALKRLVGEAFCAAIGGACTTSGHRGCVSCVGRI